MGPVACTRGNAVRGEAWVWVWMYAVVGAGTLDVAVCVCWCGRVRLGGHNPSERREGRVDVDGRVLVLFFHVWRDWMWWVEGRNRAMREEERRNEARKRGRVC